MKKRLVVIVLFFCTSFISRLAVAQQFSQFGTEGTIAQKLITNLNAGKYDDVRSDFALIYKNSVSREVIAQNWEGILSILGSYKGIVSVTKYKDPSGIETLKVRCQMDKENINVEITFNVDNKIIFLRFQQ